MAGFYAARDRILPPLLWPSIAPPFTHRHDVDESGHANTADFALTYQGEIITPTSHPETYEKLFELGASTFSGIGHYGSYVHMGNGSEAAWGPDTTSATLAPNFAAAINRGRG